MVHTFNPSSKEVITSEFNDSQGYNVRLSKKRMDGWMDG